MAEEREVLVKINVAPPKGDGFKQVAADAGKAGKSVDDKLKDMQARADGFGKKTSDAFARAGEGAIRFSRGLAMIASSGGGMEKLVRTMAGVQGLADLFEGGAKSVMGMANGIVSLNRVLEQTAMKGGILQKGLGFLAGVGAGGLGFGAGAALLGGLGVSTVIPGASEMYARMLSGTSVGDMLGINAGMDREKLENRFKFFDNPESNPDLSGEELNKLESERFAKMLFRQRAMRIGRQFGFGDPMAEAEYLRDSAIRNPIMARQRVLGNLGEQVGLGLSMFGEDQRRFRAGMASEERLTAFADAREAAFRPGAQPGAIAALARQGQGLVSTELAGPKGTAATARAVAEADLARVQALRNVEDLQKRIAQVSKTEGEKRLDLNRQLVQGQQELLQAEQRRMEAGQAHANAERDRLMNLRKFAAEQAQFFKQQVEMEKERLAGQKEQFALMDPMKRLDALRVSQKVAAKQELTADDIEAVRGIGAFDDAVRKQALRNFERDPVSRQTFANLGVEGRLRDAQAGAAAFEKLKIDLTQKVEAEIKVNEESLAQQIQKNVLPVIQQAITQLTVQLKQEIAKALFEIQANRPGG